LAIRRNPERLSRGGLAAALLFLVPAGAVQAGPRIVAGEPVVVSGDRPLVPHVEPILAAHPSRPGLLFGAAVTFAGGAQSLEDTAIAGFRSADGGRSWSRVLFPDCRIDPWVRFGRGDRLVLTCLGKQSSLVVYRSPDAGQTWEGPVRISSGGGGAADRPVLAASLNDETLTVAFGQSSPAPGLRERSYGPSIARSTDGGRTFAEPVPLRHDNVTQQPFDIAQLSSGALVLFFMDYATPSGEPLAHRRTWAARSEDGGRTFSLPALVREQLGQEMPWAAAVDRSSLHRDRLYLAVDGSWERRKDAGPVPAPEAKNSLFLLISDDGGESWRTGGGVGGSSSAAANAETPAVAVNDRGIAGIAWYDTRRDLRGECYDLYFTASVDGGATFLPEVRVTSEPSCPKASARQRGVASRWPFGGDYSGLAAGADGRFHLFWADSSSGTYQIRTSTVQVNP
jgi:hypothetical protein